jgi:type III restriction enzyme
VTQINAVENPIINKPYEEPRYYWLIRKGEPPEKREGRRPASYFFRVPERAARGRKGKKQVELFEEETKGEEYLLPIPNLIRERLKEWQVRDYDGATRVTKELLALWHSEDRNQRLFFAQREAAESVIFLAEAAADLLQGMQIPTDEPGPEAKEAGYRAFARYALKMATGSGKTTVMGMLTAWSILNKVADPTLPKYSDTVLIICPNVTIRDRLRELDPNLGELSLYRTRELVPAHRMDELRRGEVYITNWHNLERREISEVNGTSAKVVKRGIPVTNTVMRIIDGRRETIEETHYYESDPAFIKRVLGGRKGRSQSVFVMNDEAHHAYRRGVAEDEEVVLDEETAAKNDREATVWIEGLDRINKVLGGKGNGVRLCVDLSATPFYIQGSGNEVGKPFPWVISEFGLLSAIEAGMVKIPQLPSQDVTGAETPPFFNIWRWVEEQLKKDGHAGALTHEVVMRYAATPINMLAAEWKKTFDAWQQHFSEGRRQSPVPPVFIVVCRDTALAKEVYEWLAEGNPEHGLAPEWFRNRPGQEVTVRVDSKVAEEIESGSGKEEARRLRFILETIGKTIWPGGRVPEEYSLLVQKHNQKAMEEDSDLTTLDETIPPGRDIRCIISVAMLSEGWDATTVTHIVGLRPFGSQLLCEQVVGRALRRTAYQVGEDGLLAEETARVFGVPFELIPFKTGPDRPQPPTPPANHIYAVEEKAKYEIIFPVVEGYHDPGIVNLSVDWARVPTLVLDPLEVPDSVLVKALVMHDGLLAAYGPGASAVIDLKSWRERVRVQQVAFRLATGVTARWTKERGDVIPTHRLFPHVLSYARELLATKLVCKGNRVPQDVGLNPYFQQAVDALFDALVAEDWQGGKAELPRTPPGRAGVRSTTQVDFHTGKEIRPVTKCHLNAMVGDTAKWEQSAAYCLDTHAAVQAWVKNDHLGFFIPYRSSGKRHFYVPDFVAHLISGLHLLVEVKGQLGDAEVKQAAARRWVDAVNLEGRWGQWRYEMVRHPADLYQLLDKLSSDAAVMR